MDDESRIPSVQEPVSRGMPEQPPAGTRFMAGLRWVLLGLLLLFALASVLWFFQASPFDKGDEGRGTLYRCPMHPQIVQDHPGTCPICGMTLVAFEGKQKPPAVPADTGQPAPEQEATRAGPGQYTCPMHPEVIRDEPGSCPICGMTLVQVPPPQEAGSGTTRPPQLSAEHSEVHLDPSRVQMIGVRTGRVERRTFGGEIRTVAYVTVDEARLSMIHTKVPGWIDRLYVSRMGERVRRGQVVATLHSLELIAAQEDFLAALRNARALSGVAGKDLQEVLAAARRRLVLFGMTEEDIDTLAEAAQVQQSVKIVSPASGYVVGREALEGHQVEPGTSLLTIGDLSEVWALLDLYESDVGRVRPGQRVKIELEALPGESFGSTIDYVYPAMDTRTRTTKARVVLPNPDGKILPGMFGGAEIRVDPRETLVVPFDALIDTGTERYVFVVAAPGHFVPTPVRVGYQTLKEVEILSGLSEGQLVVTSGNFLLDSESRMLGAGGTGPATGPKSERDVTEAGHPGH